MRSPGNVYYGRYGSNMKPHAWRCLLGLLNRLQVVDVNMWVRADHKAQATAKWYRPIV
jgi:hypothetical protein